MLLGLGICWLLGFNTKEGLFIGLILAQTSSAVIASILKDRDEGDTVHGRTALGISIVQDILSVPMLVMLIVLTSDAPANTGDIAIAVLKAAGIVAITWVVGRAVWPRVLALAARGKSKELMLLTTLCLAVGGGLAVEWMGFSFAVGAFFAGLVIAESEHRHDAIAGIEPLRDVLVAVFFVTVGMLFHPSYVIEHPWTVVVVLLAATIGKAIISAGVVRAFRYTPETALLAGLLLGQLGEFAFLLAQIGFNEGVLGADIYSLTIAVAVFSLLLNMLLLDSAPPVLAWTARVTHFPALATSRIYREIYRVPSNIIRHGHARLWERRERRARRDIRATRSTMDDELEEIRPTKDEAG
jgi:CPA2 family monovalent cation:H+ antiporter-2